MKYFNPIGGYFELELQRGLEYHRDCIALNTGRNALEYILKVNGYNRVFIPYYTCEVLLEPFKKTKTKYGFYNINEKFKPINLPDLGENDALLYTNYYGINESTVRQLKKKYSNLIVDNSQAFFDQPLYGTETFYSCRKF